MPPKNKIKIIHANGSSKISPKCHVCGSWIEHYKNRKNITNPKCCACGKCANVGAHIQLCQHGDWWIVPMCKTCHDNKEGYINKSTPKTHAKQC